MNDLGFLNSAVDGVVRGAAAGSMARMATVAAILACLGGCGSAARTPAENCAAAGEKPGSPAYERCVSREDERRTEGMRRVLNGMPATGYGPMRF